ncbi:hypothetical protein FSST1_006728 [Fusarium sambucinum]
MANKSTPDLHSPDRTSPSVSVSGPCNTDRLRSCLFCRQRKVRCDRQQPCSNCLRFELDCSYPAGRGRAKRRLPLVDRLQRLEDTIRNLAGQVDASNTTDGASPAIEVGPRHDHSRGHPSTSNGNGSIPDASIDQQLGRLMIDDSKSYYISNIMWANLGNEIEELRDLLHDPVSDDEDYNHANGYISETASPFGTSAAMLGFRSLVHSLRPCHPPMQMSVALLTIFRENVLPLVHIFHMPTTEQWYWDTVVSLDSLNKNTETLLFSIYYSAIISMDDTQCLDVLGSTRSDSLDKYRFAVEQALSRANLLNTQSFVLLQAVVLFLSGLRNEDDSRTTWSLTSLIFHIAQAMGLHRDGTTFGLKPLDTELRRRLWWHICLLDMRSSEFHGYEPIVHEGMFDTRLPLNINDSDISHLMTQSPQEHQGATEMTFCLVRCEGMRAGWRVSYASPTSNATADGALEDREAVVQDLKTRLETQYLLHCNESVPFMLFTSTVARLIIARTCLAVHYPSKQKPENSSTMSKTTRDLLFSTSTEVLELSSFLLDNSRISKWTWHSKTHIQWHAAIFVLSEICTRPSSAICDRAWKCVSIVHNRWNVKESGKRGNLWRPIKRLMAKARYVREMQQTDPTFCQLGPAALIPSDTTSIPDVGTGLQPGAFPNCLHNIPGTGTSGEYIDWMLGDLGIDMYGGMAEGFEN